MKGLISKILESLKPESPEELRKRLGEMSDLELRRFGERAPTLSDPKLNFGATEPHVMELEEGGWNGAGSIQSCQEDSIRWKTGTLVVGFLFIQFLFVLFFAL